ncbi:MAG: phosphatase PAP2 family protein [Solobacterium sp.]|nr:phosphatase PAP2 family protein [Solobacterium sp.]
MKISKTWMQAILYTVLFVLLAILLKAVDVQAIGPEGSSVGFAGLNGFVHELWPEGSFWKLLTTLTGIVTIAVMVLFAVIGGWQLYTGKSLQKVDRRILAMGAVYVVLIVLYIVFDKVVINYRPVLDEGKLEASYPSTHAMLATAVYGTAIVLAKDVVTRKKTLKVIVYACIALLLITVIGRLLSGVHWFTDILGGVFAGLALVYWYKAFLEDYNRRLDA